MDCTTYGPAISSSERPWLRLVMDSARDWFAPAPVAAVQPVRRDTHRAGIARCLLASTLHRRALAERQRAEALPLPSTERGLSRIRAAMLHDAADFCMWLAGGDRDEARLALRRALAGRRLLREARL